MSTLHDWVPDPGAIICWHPSAAASLNARHAPVSPVPPSYQQTQHLRRYCDHAARGLEMTRMMIFTWELPGRCDLRAMGYAINAHLRRHDTYRTWFEYKDADDIVRRTIDDPAEIEFVPIEHNDMTTAELRDHISAPHPLQWGCFLFGVIQSADHFTVYASIGHLCVDLMIVPVLFTELHTMYTTLVRGGVPAPLPAVGKYEDYCARQRSETSALTADSPSIRAWFEFAEHSGGTLPHFPLPLGDLSVPCTGELLDVTLMDEQQTRRFDDLCAAAGARFSGGVFGCAALTEHELTGEETISLLTTTDTRSTPTELATTGWFTGLVPVTVPVTATSFGDTARAAQNSFDSGHGLASVPFDRALELAPPELMLRRPRPGNFVMSFLDASIAPLSAVASSDLDFRIYDEGRVSHQVSMWVGRFREETKVMVLFPSNPVARESVIRYLEAMKSVFVRVADGRRRAAFAPSLKWA